MMKLSVMIKVDNMIDTEGHSRIADQILEQWEHEPGSARFFRSSNGFVYTFQKGNDRYFLRFADSSERTEASIQAEVGLLRWIASQGMAVATPVASISGRDTETIETDMGTFHAVVFPQLQGDQHEIEELNAAQFEVWGATLGRLHTVMNRYRDPQVAARPTWRDHLALISTHLPQDAPGVRAEYEYLAAFLDALPVTEANYGLIHGDFELDNLFWQGDTLAMLDFDDCASDWYVADVAFALRDLFEDGVDLNHPSFRAFVRGYTQHAPLDEERLAQLPTWMRLANLFTYAKLTRAMDLPPDRAIPEDFAGLITKLENKMCAYEASLVSAPV